MATHAAAMLLTIAIMTTTALAQGEYHVDALNLITSPNSCDATPSKFAIINYYDDPACFMASESLPVYLDVCCFNSSTNQHHQTSCFDDGDGRTGISVIYGRNSSCGNSSQNSDFFYDGKCESLPKGKSMKLESSPCKIGIKPDWLTYSSEFFTCTEPLAYVLYEAYLDSNCSSDKFIKYATLPIGQCCDYWGRAWSNDCLSEFDLPFPTTALVAAQRYNSCSVPNSETRTAAFEFIWANSLSCSGFGGTYNRMSSVSSRTCGNRFNNASSPRRPSPMAPLEVTTSLPVGIIAGATAGGAVFGFLLLAAIGVAMYFLVYKRKNSGTSVVLQSPMVEDDIKVHSMDVRPAP